MDHPADVMIGEVPVVAPRAHHVEPDEQVRQAGRVEKTHTRGDGAQLPTCNQHRYPITEQRRDRADQATAHDGGGRAGVDQCGHGDGMSLIVGKYDFEKTRVEVGHVCGRRGEWNRNGICWNRQIETGRRTLEVQTEDRARFPHEEITNAVAIAQINADQSGTGPRLKPAGGVGKRYGEFGRRNPIEDENVQCFDDGQPVPFFEHQIIAAAGIDDGVARWAAVDRDRRREERSNRGHKEIEAAAMGQPCGEYGQCRHENANP